MASRAEAIAVERWPGVGSAFRAALGDFYLNSLRFVAANLVWSAVLIGVWLAYQVSPPGALLLPLVAFPTASIFRIAVLVVRGGPVSWWDGLRVWRTEPGLAVFRTEASNPDGSNARLVLEDGAAEYAD